MIVASLPSCGGGRETAAQEPVPQTASSSAETTHADPLANLQALFEKMCACKEKWCAIRVDDEVTVTKWRLQQQPPLSDEETKRVNELSERIDECKRRALAVEAPGEAP